MREIVDTYSEEWRHECEVRAVASMFEVSRIAYLKDVEKRRGEKAAEVLRNAVLDELERIRRSGE